MYNTILHVYSLYLLSLLFVDFAQTLQNLHMDIKLTLALVESMTYMYNNYLSLPCVPELTPPRRSAQRFAELGCSSLQTSYQDQSKAKEISWQFFG
jgi:hypothetical protein